MARLFFYVSTLLSCTALFAQSAAKTPTAESAHITGATKQCGEPVRGTFWVRFDGTPPLASKAVKTDDSARYETDLPFGVWTMSLLATPQDTTGFARPRHFQVDASGTLVLDINIRPPIACSVRGTEEQRAAACWGEEFYAVPSDADVSFEVDLFGLPNELWTPCSMVQGKKRPREVATYNLLSIEADRVAYHPSEKILEASGNVLMQDQSGEHKADSVSFKIQDGLAIPLKRDGWH